jgi:hypothetical protein
VDVSTWGGSEWQAVAAFIAVFVGGPIALWQVLEARRVRLEQTRPYVIVDFEFRSILICLRIQNIGTTMARDVRIKFDQPLTSTFPNSSVGESRVFREPIPMLAPGRTISIPFDSFPARHERRDEFPMEYTVTIEYDDGAGHPYSDPPYPLDLGTYNEAAADPNGLPELVQEVEKIRKEMHRWTQGTQGLLVHGVDHERRTRRQHRPWLRQQAAQVRKEQGLAGYVRWQVDQQLRRYGWRR